MLGFIHVNGMMCDFASSFVPQFQNATNSQGFFPIHNELRQAGRYYFEVEVPCRGFTKPPRNLRGFSTWAFYVPKCRGRIFFFGMSRVKTLRVVFKDQDWIGGDSHVHSHVLRVNRGVESDDAKSHEHVGKSTSKSCMAFEEDWKVWKALETTNTCAFSAHNAASRYANLLQKEISSLQRKKSEL